MLSLIFALLNADAQMIQGLSLKTRPMRYRDAFNPSLDAEFVFNKHYSLNLSILRNEKWVYVYQVPAGFIVSDYGSGVEFRFAPRIYFKDKAPAGFYSSFSINSEAYNIQNSIIDPSPFIDGRVPSEGLRVFRNEIMFSIGYQLMALRRVSLDMNVGAGWAFMNQKFPDNFTDPLLSLDDNWNIFTADLNFALGYYIDFKRDFKRNSESSK
jgi:hypothetical protein